MTVTIRYMLEEDIPRVGAVMVAAFNDLFRRHGHPEPFPSPAAGTSIARGYPKAEAVLLKADAAKATDEERSGRTAKTGKPKRRK